MCNYDNITSMLPHFIWQNETLANLSAATTGADPEKNQGGWLAII